MSRFLKFSDAGFFVSAVNPHLIKDYDGNNSLRKVKSDPADAKKIAGYTFDMILAGIQQVKGFRFSDMDMIAMDKTS